MKTASTLETVRLGAAAGAAGGLAEVAWILVYSWLTGTSAASIARGVTTAAGVDSLLPTFPAALGVAVHMALAMMLGVLLAFCWRILSSRWPAIANPFPVMLAALGLVWAINFFIVLPAVGPAFVHSVPYVVSLTSKLLFGLAAAVVFRRQEVTVARFRVHPYPW